MKNDGHCDGNPTDPIIVSGVCRTCKVSVSEWIQFPVFLFLERNRKTETLDGRVELNECPYILWAMDITQLVASIYLTDTSFDVYG